jgi:gamma-glutamyl-gamma-aminobutyrate hydrolase PuuD
VVGLQFHPERMLAEYPGNWRLWKAFGQAVHDRGRS